MKRFFIFNILSVFLTVIFLLSVGCGAGLSASKPNTPPPTQGDLPDAPNDTPSTDLDGGHLPSVDVESSLPKPQKEYVNYAVATTSSLRIRSLPSSSGSVLGYLDQNDALVIEGEENGYYKTTFLQKRAYVHKSYCKVMPIEKGSSKVEKATELGSTLLGYPYVWGSQRYHWGNGVLNKNFVMGEFDCSAFVQYIYYHSNGVILDVTTRTQVYNGIPVEKSKIQRGDLMFFTNSSRKDKTGNERIAHVAIYLGNNYILHTASDHAVIEPISSTRWSYYICSRRVV